MEGITCSTTIQIINFTKTFPIPLLNKNELKQKCTNANNFLYPFSKEEEILIHTIKERTKLLNQNNVTRTRAYYQFYKRYPEIHWALLGHMVSRNGGWNMTDLKGIYIRSCYLRKINLLSFLFRTGNWLIFQDVYPQFLLYEQSVKIQKSFYLLPHLNVSTFMETMWNFFGKPETNKY